MAFEDLNFEMSESELHAMAELWDNPGAAPKVIAFNLYQKYDWAPGTSYTVLSRCVKKGFAGKDERGGWYPIIDKETVRLQRLRAVTVDLFEGSAVDVACALVRKGFIPAEEQQKLRQALEQME